jgi:cyclopropane fatty-acyl-phospholipid synthase-like methyltransferase
MIIWERQHAGNHYQVRSAGASIRLYRNQVFHSQYHGGRLLNGGVWDMLWLPLFFRQPDKPLRVLVLGVGAGAAIKKISDYVPSANITGVDIDKIHLHVARRFVGLDRRRVRLIHADAIDWLQNYNGPSFDLIVDDLFFEHEGEPCRAIAFAANKGRWFRRIKACLAPNGLLIANCVSSQEARSLVSGALCSLPSAFSSGYTLREPNYENIICIASRRPLTLADWRDHLASALGQGASPVLSPTQKFRRLA